MDSQREKFEAWATKNGFDATEDCHPKYRGGKVFWMWKAWKEAVTCTESSQICVCSSDMHNKQGYFVDDK